MCEGQSFLSLNTYDRARFTSGFGQFAAHVENGDFVRWFRDMLQRPEAIDYFPNLEVRNGRIVRIEDTRTVILENDDTTEPLQKFFNPTLDDVEDAEVIGAAKCHLGNLGRLTQCTFGVMEARFSGSSPLFLAEGQSGHARQL